MTERRNPASSSARGRRRPTAPAWILLLALSACTTGEEFPAPGFVEPAAPRPFSKAEVLKEFDAAPSDPYHLGAGDQVSVHVWEKPELSGLQFIGPDGAITVPVVGTVHVSGLTREEAAVTVQKSLSRFYTGVAVTLRVEQYVSNRVTVMGRVKVPGVIRFEKSPSLLEAIARAGGLLDGAVNLTHCAVIRGRDRVAWIDLKSLSDGRDPSLNLNLKADDLILVPEDGDLPVYVLGQVMKPGAYRWTRGMSFMDAISLAGGPTRDGLPSRVLLVRPSENRRVIVSLDDVLDPVTASNVALKNGDILYVPTNVLADIGYLLEKLNPYSWYFAVRSTK